MVKSNDWIHRLKSVNRNASKYIVFELFQAVLAFNRKDLLNFFFLNRMRKCSRSVCRFYVFVPLSILRIICLQQAVDLNMTNIKRPLLINMTTYIFVN